MPTDSLAFFLLEPRHPLATLALASLDREPVVEGLEDSSGVRPGFTVGGASWLCWGIWARHRASVLSPGEQGY